MTAIPQDVIARYRELGEARIEVSRQAKSREDWDRLWKAPLHPFPFEWGECWKQTAEYKVADFAAEVGFFIDIIGMTFNAIDPSYAMFTNEALDFCFSVVRAPEGVAPTPPDAIALEFMIDHLVETADTLRSRGVEFEAEPAPFGEGSPLCMCRFRTPNGIAVRLWGVA